MSSLALAIMVGASVIVTAVVVFGIPRERQSPLFDRVLWLATAMVAFFGAWLAVPLADAFSLLQPLSMLRVGDVPFISIGLGALGGALVVNVPLWLMDRFASADVEDDKPDEA